MVELPRIGAVSYSNVAPLVAGLPPEQLRRGVPSRVADWLATGEIDIGLVPVIELARSPGLRGLPGWGVAADGRCLSVLLFARAPLSELRSVALDGSSRSGAALVRILLEREGCKAPRLVSRDEGSVEERLRDVDAALVIGDPALTAEIPTGVSTFDLATEWKRHVGLPFVFAVWAARAGFEPDAACREKLVSSAEEGLNRLGELAAAEAERLALPKERVAAYLSTLQYRLSGRHLDGLRAFVDEAFRVGVLPERPELRFLEGDWA